MCTYALARFSCRHEIWGRRIKLCTIGEDFARNEIETDCTFRGNHPMKTMVNSQPCYKCMQTKALPSLCREKLQQARSAFKERWPEVASEQQVDAAVANGCAEAEDPNIRDEKHSAEQVVEISSNPAGRPNNVASKIIKPAGIPKPSAALLSPKKKSPPPSQKITGPTKNTSPTPKTAPSRLSRLAIPTRKTPEKASNPASNGPKVTPPKGMSKLPKPGFLPRLWT